MKIIVSAIITAFAVTSYSGHGFEALRHMNDSIHGAVLEFSSGFTPAAGLIIARGGKEARYSSPYRGMPGGLTRAGSILLYAVPADQSLRSVAHETIRFTDYYTIGEMCDALKKANGLKGERVAAGEVLLIPNPLPVQVRNYAAERKRALVPVKGLYVTGSTAGRGSFPQLVQKMKEHGINAVVFDAKDITGIINYQSSVPWVDKLNTHEKRPIQNIGKMIRLLKENGILVIARLAVFQDHLLAEKAPSLAIGSRKNGGVWNKGSKEIWLDPTNKQVQQYVMDLSMELLDLGADEIQFDYIRFPTTGNLRDAIYAYDYGKMPHQKVITHFLDRAHRAVSAKNALLSVDIFGVVAWGKEKDIANTGQDIAMLAKHCDVISPMLYPSHFNDDFDGFANPGDQPYYFIYEGCRKVIQLSGGKTAVRPWLQAFRWRVSNYNSAYIREQQKGSDEAGAAGYLFWNASNDYGNVWRALKR